MTFSDQEEDSQKNNEGKLIGDSSDIVSSISKSVLKLILN